MTGAAGFSRNADPVRKLSAEDLQLVPQSPPPGQKGKLTEVGIEEDDPIFETTRKLLDYYGGVIYVGPPGTSKSYYAQAIALLLTGLNEDLVRFVQFHPSYQYEDFVEGYVPDGNGGFELAEKHLLQMCERAEHHPNELVVLVIDELSRGEPGRVFGEALTYVEKTKRGLHFSLSSGRVVSIPANLVFLCTMNPLDRGVDEVDAAFERRFAKIAMDPDVNILDQFLVSAGMEEALHQRVRSFFTWANRRSGVNPLGVGHTFFLDVSDEHGLRRLWNHQLRFLFEKAYQLDPDGLKEVHGRWRAVTEPGVTTSGDAQAADGVTAGDETESAPVASDTDAGGPGEGQEGL